MAEPKVTTSKGTLRGTEQAGVAAFKGIPFGAPPTGERRFRPPQPGEAWDGVRDATAYGPICPQMFFPADGPLSALAHVEPTDEDCLFLNVTTPDPGAGGLPVMVWIHGGGFSSGSGSHRLYESAALAGEGVVVVTLNYRLHALGFLYLDELFVGAEGTGNLGILDQIAALRWVQEDIAAFGGDPGNVTIFGESAGGMSVGTLLGTRAARGLFHRAIPQSGAGHHNLSAGAATRVARKLLEAVGVEPGDWDALLSVSAPELINAQLAMAMPGSPALVEMLGDEATTKKMAFEPVVDGITRDKLPIEAIRGGEASDVDVLIGCNSDEWRLMHYAIPEAVRGMAGPPDVNKLFAGSSMSGEDVLATYKRTTGGDDEDVNLALETDMMFAAPARQLADAQVRHNPNVFRYRFSWRTPVADGVLGSCHALELPFVFGNLDVPALLGDAPPAELSAAMRKAWTSFAASGDPNTDGLPSWPRHDPDAKQLMDFGTSVQVIDDPDAERLALWEGVL